MGNSSIPWGSPMSARAVEERGVIFRNPAGAPELACDECGSRMFDRIKNCCYECGLPVREEAMAEFETALLAYTEKRDAES